MGRPKKPRYCRAFDGVNLLKPAAIPLSELELINLDVDELEAMRICDFEGHDQATAAKQMGVSRGTIQRILQSGRRKLLDTIIHGKALTVSDAAHVITRSASAGKRKRTCQQHGDQPTS